MRRAIIDFVCAWPGFHIRNRGSAVGSMACSALMLLEDEFEIRANGRPFSEHPEASKPAHGTIRGLMLRRLVPGAIKRSLREAVSERWRARMAETMLSLDPAPDLIFELYKYGSNVGRLLSKARNAPLLLYFDAPEVVQAEDIVGSCPPRAARALSREHETLLHAHAIVVYSEPVKLYLIDFHGCDSSRVHVFQTLDYSRMSTAELPPPRTPVTIGYVGSFMDWHNLPMLVDAFEILRGRGIDARLLLIGSGLARTEVERRVARSRYRADIEMPGFLDGPTLAAQKQRIDVAVLPGTMWYNLPTKLFEYGAASRAAVAPRSATVESLFVDSEDLLTFRENDREDLAAALGRLAESPSLRAQLGANLSAKIRTGHGTAATREFYSEVVHRLLSEVNARG